MSLWLDYSFARPSIPQMKKDGVVGVLRYLGPDDPNNAGKLLRSTERDALLAAGLDIALNWEWYAGRALEGYAAGVQDARAAEKMALALNYPAGKTIYFSHDTGQFNQSVLDYFRGVKDTLRSYLPGAYGSYETITKLHSAGLVVHGWQTLAWSNGLRDPWAVVYQTGQQWYGGAADVDQVTSTDIGSWLDGPNSGGLMSAEYDALKKQIADLGNLLVNDDSHAGHVYQQETVQLARREIAAVKRVADDLDIRVAKLQEAVSNLQATQSNGIDIPAVAKAVIDEEQRRLAN